MARFAFNGRTYMTDEQTIEQRLAPSTILSHALDFMETDLDANACNVISSWVARATHEIKEELARLLAIDPETLKGLPAARMKIESGRLWLHIFTQIREAIACYVPAPDA